MVVMLLIKNIHFPQWSWKASHIQESQMLLTNKQTLLINAHKKPCVGFYQYDRSFFLFL